MSNTHSAQLSLLEVAPSPAAASAARPSRRSSGSKSASAARASARPPIGRRFVEPTLSPEAAAARDAANAETTAHCARLLAELDRAVATRARATEGQPEELRAATPKLTRAQEARMMHLARLFEAIEQVHESDVGAANAETKAEPKASGALGRASARR